MPIFRAPYWMAAHELKELKTQMQGLLEKCCMGHSNPLHQEEGRQHTVCIDYSMLNQVMVKNHYALPRIDDLSAWISCSILKDWSSIRLLSVSDSKWGCTKGSLYELLVMSFRLTNAPTTFMGLMNWIFQPYVNQFVIVFVGNILIYSRTREMHKTHLKITL